MNCLQKPHGAAIISPVSYVMTYTYLIYRQPLSTILTIAVPSAQTLPTDL